MWDGTIAQLLLNFNFTFSEHDRTVVFAGRMPFLSSNQQCQSGGGRQ